MPHGFDMYRVFISAPGDRALSARPATMRSPRRTKPRPCPPRSCSSTSAYGRTNTCRISLHCLGQRPLVRVLHSDIRRGRGSRVTIRKLFHLAVECRDDASLPMREVVVCLKDSPHETDRQILEFRRKLEDRRDVRLVRSRATTRSRPNFWRLRPVGRSPSCRLRRRRRPPLVDASLTKLWAQSLGRRRPPSMATPKAMY